ncbi:hypothetical protein BCR44DRAFT_1484337 [Catenaria anguillulae PL171]|uniref:Uncharacterized protein n=1 Tax=Catenaria anguillulae PL171 TaxID=765915 RepID=A0A1Y2HR62_9FUNG|nr:hypothetical protein BCR44DRAFT_1484337 [Catenaria anguillulae PL171]
MPAQATVDASAAAGPVGATATESGLTHWLPPGMPGSTLAARACKLQKRRGPAAAHMMDGCALAKVSPFEHCPPASFNLAHEDVTWLDETVAGWVDKGSIGECPRSVLSPFAVVQPSGDQHVYFDNGCQLNRLIKSSKYMIQGIHAARDPAHVLDWAGKFDAKDAYHTMCTSPTFREYFAFTRTGQVDRWQTLVFGLKSVAFILSKGMDLALGGLVSAGYQIVLYSDDCLVVIEFLGFEIKRGDISLRALDRELASLLDTAMIVSSITKKYQQVCAALSYYYPKRGQHGRKWLTRVIETPSKTSGLKDEAEAFCKHAPTPASSHPSSLHAAGLPAAFQSSVGQISPASISNTSASFPLASRVDALTQAHSAAALDRACDVAALRAEMARFREHMDRQLANMQENFEAAAATYSQSLGPALLDEHQIWAKQFELEQELSELRVEVDRLAEWSSSGSECEEEWEGEDIEEQGQAMEAYVDADYAKGTSGLREGSGESGSDSDDVESE